MSCFRHGVFSFPHHVWPTHSEYRLKGPTHVFTSKFLAEEEEASSSVGLRKACLMWEVKRSMTFLFFALTGTFDLQHHRNVFTSPFDSVETATALQQTVVLWMTHGRAPCVLFMAGIEDMRNDLLGRQSSSVDVFTMGQQEFIY